MRLPAGEREAWIVVDLGFGDQGKGSVTDFLVRDRRAHTVVRYNGGAQAAHNVVTDDGRHHTFAQFGAGSFVPGVRTVLASRVAIQPWAMLVEAEHLARVGVRDAFERTVIAADCVVVTPFHRATHRLRELARGAARHGSCGVGVGEAVADARAGKPTIRARDLFDPPRLLRLLREVQAHKAAEVAALAPPAAGDVDAAVAHAELADRWMPDVASGLLAAFRQRARVVEPDALGAVFAAPGAVVFEGAHGVLLDEDHGFHPYTTWSSCTDRQARDLLTAHAFDGDVRRLGIVRAYATRHGPGPFPTADASLVVADPHNALDRWQGAFRVGWFDAVATRYAIAANGGVDGLAVTCLDRLPAERPWSIADAYSMGGDHLADLPLGGDLDAQAELGRRLELAIPDYVSVAPERESLLAAIAARTAPIVLTSDGPTAAAKRWCSPPIGA
ncbi:MAG: adenylosuccinate synthetase [Myxococcota bacterium]